MAEFEVIFYEKENGDCLVEEFITNLDAKMRAKMVGLLEIRCKVGNNHARILYFFYYEGKIILTNGSVKKLKKHHQKKLSWRKNAERILRKGWVNYENIETIQRRTDAKF